MAKFAIIDAEGFPTAFYDEDVHGARLIDGLPNPACRIPTDAMEIADAQWVEFLNNQGLRKWIDGDVVTYEPPPLEPVVPDRLSRRQFRLALIDAGLLEQVEAWIATQDIRTQAAYADSSTFLRTDEMLQQGFTGLGFTNGQIDQFFTEAALL